MTKILTEKELVGPGRKKYICPVCEKELTYIEREASDYAGHSAFRYLFEHRQIENKCNGSFVYFILNEKKR